MNLFLPRSRFTESSGHGARVVKAFLLIALLAIPAFAQDKFQAEITETDPPEGIVLKANEPLYVRLKYQSNQPLRFQAAGYLNGSKINRSASFNPAPAYAAGGGETLAWLAYYEAITIDEVRVTISDQNWKTLEELSLPIDMRWSGEPPQPWRQPAAWVDTLSKQQQSMAQSSMPASDGNLWLWSLLMMFMGWSIPGYIVLQIYMLKKYEGRWRMLAKLPLWGMIPLFAYTLFALIAGSNLWPLVLLFIAPFAFIYLLLIMLIKNRAS